MLRSDLMAAERFALLDQIYEADGNALGTAHVYADGSSERIAGRWLRSRGIREQMVVITKRGAHSQDRRRMTPYDVASDLFDSLERLNTDYIDFYLLHRDDTDIPLEPIVNILHEHLQAGCICAFGASN